MKKYVLLVISILYTEALISQEVTIFDTLKTLNSDSAKLKYLTEHFTNIIYSDPAAAYGVATIFDSIAEYSGRNENIVKARVVSGMAHYVNHEFDKSLESYVAALELEEYIDTDANRAKLYNNIAAVYQIREDPSKSIEYYLKALDIHERLTDTLGAARVNSNLGLIYLNSHSLVKAEHHLEQAISFYKRNKMELYEGFSLLNYGNLQIQLEQYSKAEESYNRALKLVDKSSSPLLVAACSNGLGVALRASNQFAEAEVYLKRGLEIAKQISHTEQIMESSNELSELYNKMGRYREAFQYHKEYAILKDSLFTAAQDAKMLEVLTKYETEQKEQKIALLDAENNLSKLQLAANNRRNVYFGVGILILSGFLFRLNWLNKKLSAAVSDKNVLLKEIHHRVKNNLQVISALLTLQSNYVQDEAAVDALKRGQDRVESMALIHKNLYQHDNLKGVDARDYFERLTEHLVSSYSLEDQDVKLEFDIENINLDVDTMIPLGLIVNELISNSIKHAFTAESSGVIKVSLYEKNNQLHLTVGDNGSGDHGENNTTKSFGKSLIKSLSRRLNAEMEVNCHDGYEVSLAINEYKKIA